MDAEIKAQWVAALRSGEYKQGKYTLKRTNRDTQQPEYCCLGVLCDIAVKARKVVEHKNPYGYDFGGESGTLPLAVSEWAGLPGSSPVVPRESVDSIDPFFVSIENVSLTELNDDQFKDFNYIADMIERHL